MFEMANAGITHPCRDRERFVRPAKPLPLGLERLDDLLGNECVRFRHAQRNMALCEICAQS